MFNIDALRLQIETLIREYPELVDDEVLREDTLDGATDIKQALTALVRKCGDAATMIDAIDMRLEEMSGRKTRFKRRVEVMRELMLKVLQSADLKKIELAEASLSQRAGQPQIVGEPDVNTLPDDLVRVVRSPDRRKIKEALEQGREVPGCQLSNAQPSLTVRVK